MPSLCSPYRQQATQVAEPSSYVVRDIVEEVSEQSSDAGDAVDEDFDDDVFGGLSPESQVAAPGSAIDLAPAAQCHPSEPLFIQFLEN